MTPTQKIKWLVLSAVRRWDKEEPLPYPCENVDELYAAADQRDNLNEALAFVRCSGEETGIECASSRHTARSAMAARLPDGTWVGWTYWCGVGAHGEPGSVPWIEDAYDVTVREETRVVRVFTKAGV